MAAPRRGFRPENVTSYFRVVERIETGETKFAALRSEQMSRRTFDRINDVRKAVYVKGGRVVQYKTKTGEARQVVVAEGHGVRAHGPVTFRDASGVKHEGVMLDFREMGVMRQYREAVANLRDNPNGLRVFQGVMVRDIHGKSYELLADPEAVIRMELSGEPVIEEWDSKGKEVA